MATENFKTQEELIVAINALDITNGHSEGYKEELKKLSNDLQYTEDNAKFYLSEEKNKNKITIKVIVGQKTSSLNFTEFVIDHTHRITKRVSKPNIRVIESKIITDPIQNQIYFREYISISQIFNSEVIR